MGGVYVYANPDLESLSSLDKLVLRLGPRMPIACRIGAGRSMRPAFGRLSASEVLHPPLRQ